MSHFKRKFKNSLYLKGCTELTKKLPNSEHVRIKNVRVRRSQKEQILSETVSTRIEYSEEYKTSFLLKDFCSLIGQELSSCSHIGRTESDS